MRLEVDIDKTLVGAGRRFQLTLQFQSDAARTVLFGPSGAGKSLTLRALAGLVRPDRGRIAIDGTPWFDAAARIDVPPRRRHVGYLFQDYALFPHLSVRQNIGFALARGLLNPRRSTRNPAVDHWLDALELGPLADLLPAQISGGQRQRTALARALVTDPVLLLLDEPFSALDAELRQRTRDELDRLLTRIGVPLVMITHDPDDLQHFGGCVVRLRGGRVDSGEVPSGGPSRHPSGSSLDVVSVGETGRATR